MLLRHDKRKLVTGTICLQVQYKDTGTPGQDVFALHAGGCGRVFVEELRGGGQAFRSGVRPDDELVLIKVGGRRAATPDGADCLAIVADISRDIGTSNGKGPYVTLFFMSFAGKFPAEVRVTEQREEQCGIFGVQDLVGTETFEVCEEVVLQPRSAPLLLVSLEPVGAGTERRASDLADDSQEGLHIDCVDPLRPEVRVFDSDEAEAQQAQGVLELEQAAAHRLLSRAVLELSFRGHPAVVDSVHRRPPASTTKAGDSDLTTWDDVLDVLIGLSDDASRTSVSGGHSSAPTTSGSTGLTFALMCCDSSPPLASAELGQPHASRCAQAKEQSGTSSPLPWSPADKASAKLGDHPDSFDCSQEARAVAPLPSAALSVKLGERPGDSPLQWKSLETLLVSKGDGADVLSPDRPRALSLTGEAPVPMFA